MHTPRVVLMLSAVVWTIAGTAALLAAQEKTLSQSELKTQLDDAIAKLAQYDFGSNPDVLGVLSDLVTATRNQPDQRKELAHRLAGVLDSGAAQGAKDFACRQLSVIGTAETVPALARLLTDDKVSHMARYALERIPGPAVDDALRQALGKLQGKLLIGTINSLGNRRDAKSVNDLAGLLGHADPAVAGAAAAALGKIGPAAAETLAKALGTARDEVRPAVADACITCADALLAQGKKEQSAELYDRVRGAASPKAVRVAATRGAILARGPAGVGLLMEHIRTADPNLFGVALSLVRELPGEEVAKAIAAEAGKLPADRQALVIEALGDRGDRGAAPAVLALVQSGEPQVRAAALRALGRVGDAAAVPTLMPLAAGAEGEVAQAAIAALSTLRSPQVDAALVQMAGSADAKTRPVVIEIIGRRRIAEATPLLLKAAADADAAIRAKALKALGDTAGLGDLATVAGMLAKAQTAPETTAAESAITAICVRVADKEACAERLTGALAQAAGANRAALLRALGQVGGAKALEAVRAALKDADAEIRNSAVRALCDWSDAAAAPDLAALAKSSSTRTHQILALRGFIRLIGLPGVSADKKFAMCQEAMELAPRIEEKKLVLGALGGVHSAAALAMVVPYLENPAAKDEASAAAVSIGEKIADRHRAEVADAMAKVLKVTANKDLQQRAKTLLARTKK